MGCTSSSLAGDDFKNIDATALSSEQAPRHSTKPVAEGEDDATANAKAKDHAENEKRFGSNAHKAGLPFAGKPRELKKKLPAGERAKNEEFVDRAAQLDKPILRTDEDRVARVEAEGKKLSPYQRWTNKRLGVGEERDPVTGRGKYTGMTKEETIAYVERTRGNGIMSGKQYYIGGAEGMAFGAVGC